MDIRRTTLVGITLVLTTLMAACTTPARDEPPAQRNIFVGTEWMLVSLNGNAPTEGKRITLRFEEASVEGSGGCNTYGGSYTASGDSLDLSGLYWTEMACMEPAGILKQEQAYFQALDAAVRFQQDGDRLALYDESGTEVLAFTSAAGPSVARVTPEPPTPTVAAPTAARVPPTATTVATATATPVPPTATPVVIVAPADSRRYVHGPSGVSLWVPESWTIIEPGPHGGPTVLQSYPQDKYVGGERREPGDSKCDLYVHPPEVSVADAIPQDRADPPVTVLSQREIVLQSGRTGIRSEVDSMGRLLSLVTEINERAVTLACFGEFAPFDEIADTLHATVEPSTSQLGNEPAAELIASIEAQGSLSTGEVVDVIFTLTNTSSEGLFVLKWFTPLEGLAGDRFLVQPDGIEIDYRGKVVKRAAPTPEDYVWIDAGASISAEIDLVEGYDFSQAGQHTVQFRSPRLSHTARTAEAQADSMDDPATIEISSDAISVTVG